MRLPVVLLALIACSVVVSGCATMQFPRAYKVEGAQITDFKDLSDDQALKVFALIYNVNQDTWEDKMAKNIALDKYMKLLKKRNSAYIKKSGVFETQYEKVNLSTWKEDDLIKLYDALEPATESYYMDSAQELTEVQNSRRIVYLTAINSIADELNRRGKTKTALEIATNTVAAILVAALSMI